MEARTRLALAVPFSLAATTALAAAQTPSADPAQVPTRAAASDHSGTGASSDLAQAIGTAVRAEVSDPTLYNRVLERSSSGRALRLIEGLHVRFQAQESSSTGDPALGLAFDFAKSIGTSETPESEAFELVAHGNIAFDKSSNPDDFTSVMFRARWFGSSAFGTEEGTREERMKQIPDPTAEELGEVGGVPDVQRLTRAHADRVERKLPAELIYDSELHAGMETNQDFSSRQLVFGLSASARPLSWNPDSALSRWNVFDLPAASLRWLAGERFRTSGRAWPTMVAGLDVVDANANDARGAVTDDESYLRARLEASMRSRAFTVGGEELHMTAAWRLFQELDAPAGVRQAGLDTTSYLQVGLELPKGWELTYAAGRLPLDDRNDSTFALGFNVQF